MNILEVKDLCKTYIVNKRQNNVLKNINFTIGEGEMVAVMGPSGSGKSTLLYAVSGMDSLTAGEVNFCGRNIAGMGERELADLRLDEMGFIFQQMYMLKNLTILDNIILPATQSQKQREPRRETARRGQDFMRRLGIIDIADNDINEVSGGQLQRACICRSMMNNPKMIFADEPTGALNRTSSDEVMEELVKLNSEGTTIMLVTHDVKVRRQINPKLQIDGILLTMVDSRTNFAKEIASLLRENYGSKIKVFTSEIPHSVRAKEISAEGKSIFVHDPGGKVAEAYQNLTKEVLKLEKQREKSKAGIGR